MKKTFTLFFAICLFEVVSAQTAWINEINYDPAGTPDVSEAVEVVVENSVDISKVRVSFYNGADGTVYDFANVNNMTVGNTVGNFTFYYKVFGYNDALQNSVEGVCLSYDGVLISGQFLSYEGSFAATAGPALGNTSVNIGVSQNNSDGSLQLSGNGTQYSAFTWQAPATATLGALNNGQTLSTSGINGTVKNSVSVYPNPFANEIVVNAEKGNRIVLTNALGQIMFSEILSDNQHHISSENYAKGLYFLTISNTNTTEVKKIVKD
jgi:hypothetical protein